jgi:hypothetical protein
MQVLDRVLGLMPDDFAGKHLAEFLSVFAR